MNDQTRVPTSSNPKDYAYAIRVDDEEVLSLRSQLQEKGRECERLQADLDIAEGQRVVLKNMMWREVRRKYDGMQSINPEGGIGLREYQNVLYLVAWDGDAS